MKELIMTAAKYFMIFLFAFYAYGCFSALRTGIPPKRRERILNRQCAAIFLIHLAAFVVLYLATDDAGMIVFYMAQAVFLAAVQTCYLLFYERASRLLTNNLCMLLAVGFVILTRLSFESAVKQFFIAVVSVAVSLLVPVFIRRVGFVRRLCVLFAAFGIAALSLVALAGNTSYGAKISLSVAGISIQPSEFVKISFVLFVAGMLYETADLKRVCVSGALAAAHVLILAVSRDLGAALILFVVYAVMLYAATKKPFFLVGGALAGAAASVAGYCLFSHVKVRVQAWQDPLRYYENQGFQVSQSLFAIGTGGWFGLGLYEGLPTSIPVVKQDFIFSAISEELGGIFALCLIMVCVSCFFMFMNIAMRLNDGFYRLTALGLGAAYAFQVFLTVGGAMKFIPSTGVTLPLVSYGGSSLLSTTVIFAMIQGMYILREDNNEPKNRKRRTKSGGEDTREFPQEKP